MDKGKTALLLIFVFGLVFLSGCVPPEVTGYLKVNVSEMDSLSPIEGAFVTVYSGFSNNVVAASYTNSSGEASFELLVGNYRLQVEADDYLSSEAEAAVSANTTTEKVVFLERKSGEPPAGELTFDEGEYITGLVGAGLYEGMEMKVLFESALMPGHVTALFGRFELYDPEGAVVDRTIASAGDDLRNLFHDAQGECTLMSSLVIKEITLVPPELQIARLKVELEKEPSTAPQCPLGVPRTEYFLNEGDIIYNIDGCGEYREQELSLKFVSIVQKGAGQQYEGVFELYDAEGNLIDDIRDAVAGTHLSDYLYDHGGRHAIKKPVLLKEIAVIAKSGAGQAVLEIMEGPERLCCECEQDDDCTEGKICVEGCICIMPLPKQTGITISAKGTDFNNTWPEMALWIDKVKQKSWIVENSEYKEYSFEAEISAGKHEIAVQFRNDLYGAGGDRNLDLDYVRINGKEYDAKTTTTDTSKCTNGELGAVVYDILVGDPTTHDPDKHSFDCYRLQTSSGRMPWSGAMRFWIEFPQQ